MKMDLVQTHPELERPASKNQLRASPKLPQGRVLRWRLKTTFTAIAASRRNTRGKDACSRLESGFVKSRYLSRHARRAFGF
jgi:hypothetical protein